MKSSQIYSRFFVLSINNYESNTVNAYELSGKWAFTFEPLFNTVIHQLMTGQHEKLESSILLLSLKKRHEMLTSVEDRTHHRRVGSRGVTHAHIAVYMQI